MGIHYFTHAYRFFKKAKLYTLLGIFGFAAGLSVFISIVLFIDHEFRMDTVYENHDRIFRIIDASDNNADLDYDIFPILKEKYPEIGKHGLPYKHRDKDQRNAVYFLGKVPFISIIHKLA